MIDRTKFRTKLEHWIYVTHSTELINLNQQYRPTSEHDKRVDELIQYYTDELLIPNGYAASDIDELYKLIKEDVDNSLVFVRKIESEAKIWWRHRSVLKRIKLKLVAGLPLTEHQAWTLRKLTRRYAPQVIKNNFL